MSGEEGTSMLYRCGSHVGAVPLRQTDKKITRTDFDGRIAFVIQVPSYQLLEICAQQSKKIAHNEIGIYLNSLYEFRINFIE